MKKRSLKILARLLSFLSEDNLDRVYNDARNLQHREEEGWFTNKHTGKWQRCRLASTDWDDPIMAMSGCSDDFANDFRIKDLKDGCPMCTDNVAENASEPDVMSRWGLR